MKKIVVYLTGMKKSGGKERVVSNLLKEWCTLYDVTLVVKDNGETFYEIPSNITKICLKTPFIHSMFDMNNNRILRMFYSLLNMFFSVVMLKKELLYVDYDYIYVTTPLNAFETLLAIKGASKKLVVSEHASINAYNKIYNWMKKIVYPRSYCVSVPNKMDTLEYQRWGCNTMYIPHLVTYEAKEQNALTSKIVINVGRLTSDKQQDKLIRIWSKINNKNNWKLWIIGDGEEHKNLQLLIHKLNLEDSVELMHARSDIDNIYKQASLFAFTSRCEGFGMVLIEAMSFGIPCISFDCPSGPRDVIADGINGYLVENGDENEFFQKLNNMLAFSQEEINHMGKEAFNLIFNWDNKKIISDWNNIFS